MLELRVPQVLNKNKFAKFWLDRFCCLHYDHDRENATELCDRYGLDFWLALCLIQKSRKFNGLRHTCQCYGRKVFH